MHPLAETQLIVRKVMLSTLSWIIVGILLATAVFSTLPVKASSDLTTCNVKNVSSSAAPSSGIDVRPGHIRYLLEFNCDVWSDVVNPSLVYSSAAAAATLPKSIGLLGGGYSWVTDAVGTHIVYPYNQVKPVIIANSFLGGGYSWVTDASGTHIVYPYSLARLSSKSFSILGDGYSVVTDAGGTYIRYPYHQEESSSSPIVTSPQLIDPLYTYIHVRSHSEILQGYPVVVVLHNVGSGYVLLIWPDGSKKLVKVSP